jgi:hypothetical protein
VVALLLVFVSSLEVVNKVIVEGFIEGEEVKLIDCFYIGYSLISYFKCYSYRYITKHYRIKARCGHYIGQHET